MTTGREVADLLVEVGTEELPPKALHGLGSAFAEQLKRALDSAQLSHTVRRTKNVERGFSEHTIEAAYTHLILDLIDRLHTCTPPGIFGATTALKKSARSISSPASKQQNESMVKFGS